jgi:phosphate transport system protein
MHTREKFERDLQQLSDDILAMASRVEEQLSLALTAYERMDPSLAAAVNNLDRQVNKMRFEIEERCLELIAMQQPAARDLRLIIAALNMIVDIERMGDQAKGVMKALKHIHDRPIGNRPPEIQQMGQLVLDMLRRAKKAYIQRDTRLAQEVALADSEVDMLYAKAFTQIVHQMAGAGDQAQIEVRYELLRIAREFERFGDLVTNVAERSIFLVTGTMAEINTDDPTPGE